MTPAEENMADLLDMIAGRPRKPLRRAAQQVPKTGRVTDGITDAPVVPVDDSDEALRALMNKIQRTYTPSTDPTRLAIADAIARHLGFDYSTHQQPNNVAAS